MVHVLGYCPACGQDKLFVHQDSETLLCHFRACPEPTAAHDILGERETKHLLKIDEGGWTLRHPLIERIDDRLMHCSIYQMVMDLKVLPEPGTYQITDDVLKATD